MNNSNSVFNAFITDIVVVGFIILAAITGLVSVAGTPKSLASSDVSLNVNSALSISLANCPTAPDPSNNSLTLTTTNPMPGGVFVSDCQILAVDTNAAGYSLSVRAENGENTNSLLYQNPTVITPLPTIPATTDSIPAPGVLPNNTWGFAIKNIGAFDSSYSINNASNNFAAMPSSDTQVYTTDQPPTGGDSFDFYYSTRVDSTIPAGTYQISIVYTVVTNDLPEQETPCGTGDYECILYTVDMSLADNPGTHKIGVDGRVVGIWDHAYDWDIFVDDQPITDCNGTNNCVGFGGDDGIAISLPTTGQHQIKILPHDVPTPGWGNAFGSGENPEGITIDAPLTTMAFAPKPSESTTSADRMFIDVFYGWTNLTTPAVIIDTYKLPDTITDLNRFLFSAHGENTSLTDPVDLTGLAGWLSNNDSITDMSGFLEETHYGNTQLTTTVDLTPVSGWFHGNNSIEYLEDFLSGVHLANHELTAPINLAPLSGWFNNNTSIEELGGFLNATHSDNYNLTNPVDLAPVSGWFSNNNSITRLDYFLTDTHSENYLLTNPIGLAPLSGWFNNNTSVDNLAEFLDSTHADNYGLTNPVDITPLAGWFTTSRSFERLDRFLWQTHAGNSSLVLTTTNATILPNWIKTMTQLGTPIWNVGEDAYSYSFGQMFYQGSTSGSDTSEVKFVDNTALSSIGQPDGNHQTYTNRTGITPLNINWK